MKRKLYTGAVTSERGIAMLIVLFSLLLLSVIGLGMMYSTNMETSINYNYRDKQIAFYAAMAGLQEARDRIQPVTHNIVAPTALPSTAAANIIYIVANASTVQPWSTTNAYFDTELCQEQVLSLARTVGVPCTTIASGTAWYQVKDDSLSSSTPWNLTNPTDLKWVRIELKANNMTPVPVNGDSSSAAQTCWTGSNQMSTPTGYTTGCQPVGGVTSVTLITSGSYTASSPLPTVTLTGGGGTGGAATAVMALTSYAQGVVSVVNLTTGGAGYTTVPTVTLIGGGGAGATATAALGSSTVTSGYVSSVSLTTGGTGYSSVPTVTISGGGGSGATAVATISTSTTVTGLVLDSTGSKCYTSAPAVSITGGGATTQATAHATLEASPSCIYSWSAPSSPQCSTKLTTGNGYTPADQKAGVTFHQGNQSFSGTLFVSNANDKSPNSFTVEDPGHDTVGYSANFTSYLQLGGSAWAGGCANITTTAVVGYRLQSITLDTPGSGYSSTPTVSFGTGSGTAVAGPTAHTGIGSLGVTGITLTNGGSGYTNQATVTVTISGGGGSGATATATLQTTSTTSSFVASVTLTGGGSNYSSAPTVTFSGGGGAGAVAVASITTSTITNYYVDHVDVTATGSGYSSNPTVTISGGAVTTAATAVSQISGGTRFGQVWMLTSFAQTKSGARSMLQMEVASPVYGFGSGGALTLDGPNPTIDSWPHSNNFMIQGNDANSCGETAEPTHPAIDGFDDPNASPATNSVSTIIDSLPRPDHIVGAGGTPSVQNGYGSLGETLGTPTGLKSLTDAIKAAPGAHYYDSSNIGSFNVGSTNRNSITYVDTDLSLGGNSTGYGILVVTHTLTMSGNFSWYGLVLVVGDGDMQFNGGGNGQIVGMMIDANIWNNHTSQTLLPSLGSPTFGWNGGGGNGIQYDHCWSTDLMTAVPFTPTSSKPLKILSFRTLPY